MPVKKRDERFVERIRENTRNAFDKVGEKMENAKEKTEGIIKENPITSVIIAAAVGAVVGVATSELIRKIRRKERKSIIKKLRRMF